MKYVIIYLLGSLFLTGVLYVYLSLFNHTWDIMRYQQDSVRVGGNVFIAWTIVFWVISAIISIDWEKHTL